MGNSKLIVPIAVASLAAAPLAAQSADEPLEMAPQSRWVLDYADNSCALRRAFGVSDEQVMLELRQYVPGDNFTVTLVSSTMARSDAPLRVRFEPDDGWVEPAEPTRLSGEGLRGLLYYDSLLPTAVKLERQRKAQRRDQQELVPLWSNEERNARERSVTRMAVGAGFEQPFVLVTGELHRPMESMRACLDELLTSWGLDPTAQGTLSRHAKPIDRMGLARRIVEAYPHDMLRAGRSARIPIVLVVGADGRATSCFSESKNVEPSFVESACRLSLRYARFEPALDAQGAPIASYHSTTIVYALQD